MLAQIEQVVFQPVTTGFAAQRQLGQSFTAVIASECRKGVLTSLLDGLQPRCRVAKADEGSTLKRSRRLTSRQRLASLPCGKARSHGLGAALLKEKEGLAIVAQSAEIASVAVRTLGRNGLPLTIAQHCTTGQARIASEAPHHHQRNLGEVALRLPRGLVATPTRKELIHIRARQAAKHLP